MKKIVKILMAALVVTACNEENIVDKVFETTTSGAVLRTIEVAPSLIFTDPTPVFSLTLEEQDAQNGGLLERVDMYMNFVDNTPGNGDASADEQLVETFAKSAFTTNEIGLPQISIVRTLSELGNLLNLATSDYTVGDSFTIRFELVLTDGRIFTNSTTSGNVSGGSYFSSPFSYQANIVCPSEIPTEGTWTGATQEGAFGVFSTNSGITFTSLGSGDYETTDVTGGFYEAFGFNTNQPGTFNDFCNDITVTGRLTGSQFNIVADPDEIGTWDAGTETLSLPWYDAGNDFEDLTVFTRD